MKIGSRLFIGAAAFFGVLFGIYWRTSYETTGGTLLAVGVTACLLIGGYLAIQVRRRGGLAEDNPQASYRDQPGPVVCVPAPSLWPLGAAFGAGTLAAGLVFGLWLAVPGVIGLVLSVIGLSLRGRDY